MNYNELTGSLLYKAVREWLDNNPGKDLGDFTKATGYTGPELQVKDKSTGRIGLRTRSTDVERAARIATQDQEYLDTLINEYGYSEKDAKAKLKQAKTKVKKLRGQVADLNKQFGKGSFTVGHLTAVAEGGGDFDRNVRLEIGKSVDGKRGNFSRAAVDELPTNIKAVLGIPSSGREAAIMDHEGLFDLELTPQDRQRIFQNPTAEFADEVIENRLAKLSKLNLLRKGSKAAAIAGIAAPVALGIPASAAETASRYQIAQETGDPLDQAQTGIAAASLVGDVVSLFPPAAPFGEGMSTLGDVANVGIDIYKEDPEKAKALAKEKLKSGLESIDPFTQVQRTATRLIDQFSAVQRRLIDRAKTYEEKDALITKFKNN